MCHAGPHPRVYPAALAVPFLEDLVNSIHVRRRCLFVGRPRGSPWDRPFHRKFDPAKAERTFAFPKKPGSALGNPCAWHGGNSIIDGHTVRQPCFEIVSIGMLPYYWALLKKRLGWGPPGTGDAAVAIKAARPATPRGAGAPASAGE